MAVREAQPGKRVELWFQDEARVGNKGQVCHRWWRRGERARGPKQIGYKWAYIYTLVHPESGADFTLVLPFVNADLMNLFLACFAATLPEDVHVVIVLDGAGWHDPRALDIPDNLTLVFQPPYCPELNPVERLWLYLKERFLSIRVLDDTNAIIDACRAAWKKLLDEENRIKSLCAFPWILEVSS